MLNILILLAGGKSSRMLDTCKDKNLTHILNMPVFLYSLKAFIESKVIQEYYIVYRNNIQKNEFKKIIKLYFLEKLNINFIKGGKERQESVFNALNAIPKNSNYVFIHDSARPLIDKKIINMLALKVQVTGAISLAHKSTNSIKYSLSHKKDYHQLIEINRKKIWIMETPQVFKYSLILKAYQNVFKNKKFITDDVSALLLKGKPISIIENFTINIKITYPNDLFYVECLLKKLQLH